MTPETAGFVVSDDGQALLDALAALPGELPSRLLTLRRRHPALRAEHAAGLTAVAEGRERARRRGFADAERLFVTPDALAQATSPGLAAWHASLLAPAGTVADLGCGIGMDTLALAAAGASVIAIERDPARRIFARANAIVRGVADRVTFLDGDATRIDWRADAAFFDPARRDAERRFSGAGDRYEPPLTFLPEIRRRAPIVLAKLSPALSDETLIALGGAVAFVSERRECKEAAVAFGGILPEAFWGALLLPERVRVSGGDPAPIAASPAAFLLDPDPAVVRAGALAEACTRLGAARMTADDAYLTADVPPERSPLASVYAIDTVVPYQPKALKRLCRERGIGRLVVKKRRFLQEPDAVVRALGLSGRGEEATLVLVADGRRHLAVLCQPRP